MLRARPRGGFAALMAVMGLVMIMALAAFIILPLASARANLKAAQLAAEYLLNLTDEASGWIRAFIGDTGKIPSQLLHLSDAITANDLDLCGKKYGGAAGAWTPHADRMFVATGVPMAIGVIQNQFILLVDPGNVQWAAVQVHGTLESEAIRLDGLLDDATGVSAGRLRWVPYDVSQGLVTTQWLLPIPPAGFTNALKCT